MTISVKNGSCSLPVSDACGEGRTLDTGRDGVDGAATSRAVQLDGDRLTRVVNELARPSRWWGDGDVSCHPFGNHHLFGLPLRTLDTPDGPAVMVGGMRWAASVATSLQSASSHEFDELQDMVRGSCSAPFSSPTLLAACTAPVHTSQLANPSDDSGMSWRGRSRPCDKLAEASSASAVGSRLWGNSSLGDVRTSSGLGEPPTFPRSSDPVGLKRRRNTSEPSQGSGDGAEEPFLGPSEALPLSALCAARSTRMKYATASLSVDEEGTCIHETDATRASFLRRALRGSSTSLPAATRGTPPPQRAPSTSSDAAIGCGPHGPLVAPCAGVLGNLLHPEYREAEPQALADLPGRPRRDRLPLAPAPPARASAVGRILRLSDGMDGPPRTDDQVAALASLRRPRGLPGQAVADTELLPAAKAKDVGRGHFPGQGSPAEPVWILSLGEVDPSDAVLPPPKPPPGDPELPAGREALHEALIYLTTRYYLERGLDTR